MTRPRAILLAIVIAVAAVAAVIPPTAGAATVKDPLRAGVGQADITPPQTGYFLGGWTRADRTAQGQSSRLFANALILQRGSRKLALVAVELFAIPAGFQEDVARSVGDLGFDPTTTLLAASHTHSGPGGFTNNPTYNTAAPSIETITDPTSFTNFLNPAPADRQLYTFLVNQVAQAIRRANADLAPATAGWGSGELYGVTQNRSLEAHLLDHGIKRGLGEGTVHDDPGGYADTIDPSIDVLRVDKLVRRAGRLRRMPIGAWSNFADHGTVVHAELQAYSGDHHAAAWRRFTKLVRRAGHVPASQAVIDVYPNSDEGDQTAGIVNVGPAAAEYVGTAEGLAMYRAWRRAGRSLSTAPALDVRWTRSCFCGRMTATGPVDSKGVEGAGFLTGSEEGRGPLYDITGVPFEGRTSPSNDPVQGDKYQVPAGNPPLAVPLSIARVGDHAIVAVPAEPTKEVGKRIKAAVVDAMRAKGVTGAVIAGLAGDYVQYVTTPEEYGFQSYEGASTLYGQNEATFLQERYAELARALANGAAAPKPYVLDPSYGVKPDGPPYPAGAASGSITAQPDQAVPRLGHAVLAWQGGPSGHDRPVDAPFVLAQRQVGGEWRTVDSDLGLAMLWRSSASGGYSVTWEVPLSAPPGAYRLVVTATRYGLVSRPFTVGPSTLLKVTPAAAPSGMAGVRLSFPDPTVNVDLTARPREIAAGVVTFDVGGARTTVRKSVRGVFLVAAPTGTRVVIPAAGAQDAYGNANAAAVTVG
jgi:hypothetical protein